MKPELDLEAFLRAGREPAPDADAGKDGVRARLAVALGAWPPAPGAPRVGTARTSNAPLSVRATQAVGWKGATLAAAGFALGLAAHATYDRTSGAHGPQVTTVTPVAIAQPTPPRAEPLPAESAVATSPVATAPTPAARVADPIPRPIEAEGRSDLAAERVLLETARTALERNDAEHAIAALDRHRQRFPRGQLREERESLAVYALVASGKPEEARAKTAEFHRAFPQSLQGAALDALTGDSP